MEMEQSHKAAGGGANGPRDHQNHHGGEEHLFRVLVNDHPVKLLGKTATGIEIKTAAIEQGVHIHLKFMLVEELPDGKRRLIEDDEAVSLHAELRFVAHDEKDHTVTVSVNEQPVKLRGRSATGAEIKTAAIGQGVLIQPNFVLQEELPNGTSKIIGDADGLHLREHLRFTAIAPDDNS
jgi:Multiubiquitin